MMSSLQEAIKRKLSQRMSSFIARKSTALEVGVLSEEMLVEEEESLPERVDSPDKIKVDLDAHQDLIVELVDAEFFTRKKKL